ncbi:hypothetical protein CVT26_015068 [Gymnopilus dilepis]|uniref:DUF6533 domain-containing protein n=1 Tax=Gymnopilus dilepis TaxID=231916 RepID=A0A409WQZ6_9AGAR|nr:hypothetical protein CVT26_015068 [Gymnopilus dilepis]
MDVQVRAAAVISAKLMLFVRGCAYAAFFLTLWEWITTLNFEALVIWRRKETDKRLRLMYFTSRYLGLLAQATNAFVVAFIQFSNFFASPDHCRMWYGFQLAVSTVLLVSMDCNLIFRLAEALVVAVCGTSAIRYLSFSDDGACLPLHATTSVIYLTAVQIGTQLVIWSMTFYKSIVLFCRHGWMKIPLLSLVTRDSLWVFILFTGLLGAMLSDAINREFGMQAAQLCYVIFPIYVAFVSLSASL